MSSYQYHNPYNLPEQPPLHLDPYLPPPHLQGMPHHPQQQMWPKPQPSYYGPQPQHHHVQQMVLPNNYGQQWPPPQVSQQQQQYHQALIQPQQFQASPYVQQAPYPYQYQHTYPQPQQQPQILYQSPAPTTPHLLQAQSEPVTPQPQPHQITQQPLQFSQQPQQNLQLSRVLQSQQLTKCTFILKSPFAIDLQRDAFYLSGNARQLGQWNLKNAVKLHPTDRSATQWQVIIELDTDSFIEYKYVIKGQMTSDRWETLPSNRLLNTSRKKEVRIIEVWCDVDGSEDWVPTSSSSPEQSTMITLPPPMNPNRRMSMIQDSMNGSRSSFHSHQIQYHPLQQNRLDSPSDASFIHEDMQHVYPVKVSSIQRLKEQNEDIPFATATDQPLHKVESKETSVFPQPQQPVAQEPQSTAVPFIKMRKALQQAFKDYETTVKKDAIPKESLDQEGKIKSQGPPAQIELDPNEPVVHVSYMLPYRLERSARRPNEFVAIPCYHTPTFLFGTLDYMGQSGKFNFYWVGIISTENKLTEAEEAQARKVLLEKKCFPVFVTLKEIQNFLIYYESLIKPKMHNFLNLTDDSQYIHDNWFTYVAVNQKVAAKVVEVRSHIKDLKMIWVHGDHLMLVPQYVRKSFQQANLGFYFHSAFPASAVFSTLYYRREFLQSLLQADMVGFHLFEYARNFLNICERLMNLSLHYSNGGFMSVNYHGRIVGVRVSHIGIDHEFIQHIMNSKDYKKQVAAFKAEFKIINEAARKSTLQSTGSRSLANLGIQNRLAHRQDNGHTETNLSTSQSSNSIYTLQDPSQHQQQVNKPVVIASIDTFTPLSGFITKLKGYQRFLQTYPSYRNKIVLLQFIPSIYCASDSANCKATDKYMTESVQTLKVLMSEIKEIAGEIHKEFGTHCLILQEGNPPLAKRLAVWSQSQIIMIATLKDGLCLPPLEFVTVKKILNDFQNSSMLISEYAGCSNAFSGFHDFNSFSLIDICKALDTALSTPPEKKAEMMEKAYKYSSKQSFVKWVEAFLQYMKQMYNPTSTVAARYVYLGLRTETLLSTNHQKVIATPLDIEQCAAKFGKSHRCLILIDHEALPRKQFGRGEMHPTDQTIMDLAEITQDSRNTVALLSCESRNYVQKVFHRVSNLWLAAESGYEYRINGQWQTLFKIGSKGWLKILKKVMQEYCDNVDGSYVEERNSTIVWNYKNTEEEHGHLSVKELYLQIKHLIGPNAPIEIVQGNGFLEVKPVQLKKLTLLGIFLRELSDHVYSKIDFLLYIGADTSNDPVFEYLKQQTKQGSKSQYFSPDCHTHLCILGKKPSKADFYVDEIEKLAVLINKLGVETKKRKKNRSYNNLNDLTSNLVQKTGGLLPAGQSTNDLSKNFQSMIDQPSARQKPVQRSFKEALKAQIPILEQDANDEESCLNFANSIKSPQSTDEKPASSTGVRTSRSRSQNFTFANDNQRDRVYSQNEMDSVSQAHSYKEQFRDLATIEKAHSSKLLEMDDDSPSIQHHNLSLTQLKLTKNEDVLGYTAQQQKLGQVVSQQIRVVLKEDHEYQTPAKKDTDDLN